MRRPIRGPDQPVRWRREWNAARRESKLRTQAVRFGHWGRGNRPWLSKGTEPILAVNFAEENNSRPAFRMGAVACMPVEKGAEKFWQEGLREFQVSIMQRLLNGIAPALWRQNISLPALSSWDRRNVCRLRSERINGQGRRQHAVDPRRAH